MEYTFIKNYPSGSDAVTDLVMSGGREYFRKQAWDYPAKKLKDQTDWIKAHEKAIPLPSVLDEVSKPDYYAYSMARPKNAMSLYDYICTYGAEEGWQLLLSAIIRLRNNLYVSGSPRVTAQSIDDYVQSKVIRNIELCLQTPALRRLAKEDTVVINGREYRNFRALRYVLSADRLKEVFGTDRQTDAHGDLTVENIVALPSARKSAGFYFIDPNPENPVKSPELDYGKLLQSLHGQYEPIGASMGIKLQDNSIDFLLLSNKTYHDVYLLYRDWLFQELSPEDVRSAYYHELVHWLRLLPYRVRRKESDGPKYYAGFIMALNDVAMMYED